MEIKKVRNNRYLDILTETTEIFFRHFRHFRQKQGNPVKNKKQIELNPQDAASRIGVSPRTILNFITQKRFEAVKVGREWFIDEASFVSFCQRYGYAYEQNNSSVAEDKIGEILSEPSNAIPKESTAAKEVSKGMKGLESLRSYQLLCEALQNIMQHLDTMRAKQIEARRCFDSVLKALEDLGAGYYAFGFEDKSRHYRRARSYLGAALALKPFLIEISTPIKSFFEFLETRVIPSITALLRKIESKQQRVRPV